MGLIPRNRNAPFPSPKKRPQEHLCITLGGSYRSFELELELRRLPEAIRWKGQVGFADREMSFAFLGTRGFFKFFKLTYDAKRDLIDLTFNAE